MTPVSISSDAAQIRLHLYEDFDPPAPQAAPCDSSPVAEDAGVAERTAEAWTEGFLTGRRAATIDLGPDNQNTATLIRCLADFEFKTGEAASHSASLMADLLSAVLTEVIPAFWAGNIASQVQALMERISPVLLLEGQLEVNAENPMIVPLSHASDIKNALEADPSTTDICLRWRSGHAEINREQLCSDLLNALVPLKAACAITTK